MDYVKLALEALAELSKLLLTLSQGVKDAEMNLRVKVEALKASEPPKEGQ